MHKLPGFKNQKLFTQAFTHRSYLNESKEAVESNERLEFLGDSILSFVISEYLYKTYPKYNEGVLTNLRSLLVNTKSLAVESREFDFGRYLLLSRGEEESGGRENDSLLANTFEAFLGAIYLDQGIEAARKFLDQSLIPRIQAYVEKKQFKDSKSLLQEFVQSRKHNSPVYKVLKEEGPAHAKIFTVGVFLENKIYGQGSGHSKQEAESIAAKAALGLINSSSDFESIDR